MSIQTICVFCGSGEGKHASYGKTAGRLGRLMAERGLGLVYGGSNIGLMGIVSAAVRDAGGAVTGIIPKRIADHVPEQPGIRLEVVADMHSRKSRMYELSDAFIAMPGGIGTLEELFEAWTWNQLGYHSKPLGLLNENGYFDRLTGFLDNMSAEGFLRDAQRRSLLVSSDESSLLDSLDDWKPVDGVKWEGR